MIDPQVTLEGTLKEGPKADIIVFTFWFLLLRMSFIVTVPREGETKAPVYIRFRFMHTNLKPQLESEHPHG